MVGKGQDGNNLVFVSNRAGHSIIGMYSSGDSVVKWVAPTFSRDESPEWSTDGKKIAFIRRPVIGGTPDSILVRKNIPWSIYVADINTNQATKVATETATANA